MAYAVIKVEFDSVDMQCDEVRKGGRESTTKCCLRQPHHHSD